ncbi:uncharacterized protein E5676_scaffold265G00590 [Cucumis melo var. makuwa]|uniref:Retrotransposon gag domain-containing protein n=1 Tax=Cucumis melo var. makuwa TaxID=1194695 RepID=A0A5D3C9F9_CUCMM|nr:uncharacterized protein E5676_scaffold265G00590 [Cucumis melo var. makuwa]
MEMINDMSKDFQATLDIVRNEITDATNTIIEETKLTLMTMHLAKDGKLWWRFRYVIIQEGRCTIDTWDSLKEELYSQFFLESVEILARQKLDELKHIDNIQEYVSSLWG